MDKIKNFLKEDCKVSSPKEITFFLEYLNNGFNGQQAYHKAYKNDNLNSCSVLASRLLRKVNLGDLLSILGHGPEQIKVALDKLFKENVSEYLKYISKWNGWEKERIEHSGGVVVTIAKELDPNFK